MVSGGQLTPTEGVRKKPLKNFKRKLQRTLESKLVTNYTSEAEQLRPVNDPEKELRTIQGDIRSDDWQTAFDALTKLRRIVHHHPDAIGVGVARTLVVDVVRHV